MNPPPPGARAVAAVLSIAALALSACRGESVALPCVPPVCPDGTECAPATGTCEPIECTPGETRCAADGSGSLERCNAAGDDWRRVGACEPKQSCEPGLGATGAVCTPASCTPGDVECQPDGRVRYCVVGVFEDPVFCPAGETCDPAGAASCVPTVCGPDTRFCESSSVARLCNALGTGSPSSRPAPWARRVTEATAILDAPSRSSSATSRAAPTTRRRAHRAG